MSAASGPLLPLRLERVEYRVDGVRVIDDVSIEFAAGPRTIILGPNGAGKSLLLRLCHGLIAPSAGRIVWNSVEPPGARRRQAMVFQRPMMLRRSAVANVRYALASARFPHEEHAERALAALDRVGLAAAADRPARALSGGEQQRLALARAWAIRPEVLFLDEPTANLDPSAVQEIEAVIDAMHADGTKIVMVTHHLGQAHRLGDEILFMHRGRIVERSGADRFFHAPDSREAAEFIRGELPW